MNEPHEDGGVGPRNRHMLLPKLAKEHHELNDE